MPEKPDKPAWGHSINGRSAEQRRPVKPSSAAPLTQWRRLEAPFFYAANAQVLISGSSATLLFTRPHPAVLPDGNIAPTPLRETVALVEMSLAALKELSSSAADVIRRAEEKSAETSPHSTPSGTGIIEPVLNSAGEEPGPHWRETSLRTLGENGIEE